MAKHISAQDAYQIMRNNKSAIVVDVRSRREYETGYIPGAISLPGYDITSKAEKTLPDLNATILVYCQSGVRSRTASALLVSMGYTNVYNFGGINAWPYARLVK